MKIVVKSNDQRPIKLLLPTGLLLNRFSAGVVCKWLKKYKLNLSKAQMHAIIKHLNVFRKKHKEWVLVEVESADGESVLIKL